MKAEISDLTYSFLSECFRVDERRGVLIWNERPEKHFSSALQCVGWNKIFAGKDAGWVKNGREVTKIRERQFQTHRLIYALWHRINLCDVPRILDHADGNPLNNRPSNLREASKFENAFNAPRYGHNTSGFKGVYFDKREGGWVATITAFKVKIYLGIYATKAEAGAAYCGAARVIHKDFYRENQEPVAAA